MRSIHFKVRRIMREFLAFVRPGVNANLTGRLVLLAQFCGVQAAGLEQGLLTRGRMRRFLQFQSLSLFRSGGAALCLQLIMGVTLFSVVGCKKPTPPPVVKIDPAALNVTAISLGQPRLAIVNGRQLGEGDEVLTDAARLRIVKISDGEVEFSSGAQVVLARLAPPKPPLPKR